MPIATKTWSFEFDSENWLATLDSTTKPTSNWQPADSAAGDPGGCLEMSSVGTGPSIVGTNHWEVRGDWESLFDVPPGSAVAAIGPSCSYAWACPRFSTGGGDYAASGPLELCDDAGVALATLAPSRTFTAASGWQTETGAPQEITLPADLQPSDTHISLRLSNSLRVTGGNKSQTTLRQDRVTITIRYTEPPPEIPPSQEIPPEPPGQPPDEEAPPEQDLPPLELPPLGPPPPRCQLPPEGQIFYVDGYGTIYEVDWTTNNGSIDITTVSKTPYVWGQKPTGSIRDKMVFREGIITIQRSIITAMPAGYVIEAHGVTQYVDVFQTSFPCGPTPNDPFCYHLDNDVLDDFAFVITKGMHWTNPSVNTDTQPTWSTLIWVNIWPNLVAGKAATAKGSSRPTELNLPLPSRQS